MDHTSRMTSEQGGLILQCLARALFAILVVIYFRHSERFFFELPAATPWLIGGCYAVLQALLLITRVPQADVLAATLDLVTLGVVLLLDGGNPPPTMALLFLAVLSHGLLHGPRRFLVMLVAAEAVLVVVMPVRFGHGGELAQMSASLFLLAALTLCTLCFGLMIWRNQTLARTALDAAWRDPETELISREALVSTAGWLIPLHERLSSPLTLVLLHHDDLVALADTVSRRLRHSDIVARYDRQHLALLLPCTTAASAEQVLHTLRSRQPDLRAALLTLNNGNAALEQVLHHLETAMPRTRSDDSHWLAHASALG